MLPPSWKCEIQKTVDEAASRQADAQNRTAEQNREISSRIEALTGELKRYNDKDDREAPKKRTRENWTIGGLIATALFTCALAGFSAWQVCESHRAYGPIKQSADAAKDQVYYAGRPDITVRSGGIVPLGDRWLPSVNVINSGGGAPVGLELWSDCVPGDKPGDPFDALHNVPSQKFTLARNDQQLIAACRPSYSLDQMLSLGSGLYMVAKVEYTDDTRHEPRFTEMCIKISDFSKALDDKGKPTLQDEWQYCPQGHNCTELDCKQK